MRWDSPAWSEVLFSSRNGLLPWAPLMGLGAALALGAAVKAACVLLAAAAWRRWCQWLMILCGLLYAAAAVSNYFLLL